MSRGREFFEKAAEATATYKACLLVDAAEAAEYFRQRAIWFVAQGVLTVAQEMKSYEPSKSNKSLKTNSANTSALSATAYGDGR